MELTQKITLELQKSAVYQCVWAKQGDDDSRKLVVQFTDAGVPYTVPTGATVVLRVRRPDGIFITSKPGTHNTDGTVSITMDGTMLAVPGTASADTCIMQGEQVLSSFNFEIRVQSFPAGTIDPGDATGENWLELIREATAGVKSVNGVKPDGNGNVEIETGGGEQHRRLLLRRWRRILPSIPWRRVTRLYRNGQRSLRNLPTPPRRLALLPLTAYKRLQMPHLPRRRNRGSLMAQMALPPP